MWRGLRHYVAVAGGLAILAVPAAAAGPTLVFTTIDFPGAVLTNVQGINGIGDLVGFYTDTAGKTHGFLRSGDHYRSIDFPGAGGLTAARGISPTGDIVGSYQRPDESGGVPVHGFLMTRRGTFFRVDYPGHQNTIPQRILLDGAILGCYHDADTMGSMHGMEKDHRGFTAIPEPMSMHNGATPDRALIVGLFTDMDGRGKGYAIQNGRFSPFEAPGASFTAAWDVNPSRVIVGVFQDGAGAFHGFQYDGQAFTRIDVPGARATRIFGINPNGDTVGAFVDASGRTHGFLAQWITL